MIQLITRFIDLIQNRFSHLAINSTLISLSYLISMLLIAHHCYKQLEKFGHGHNIGLVKRKEETWREAAKRLKEKLVREGNKNLPKMERGDKIIISHTHTPFYDMENGVFATGTWKVKKELEENEEYIKRNVGVFIIIKDEDRNDPIKMKRWMKEGKNSGGRMAQSGRAEDS
ncbi:MAG: hypothetical protein ACTSO7_18655 [Candidatus Heimdallarchaeota archaeon]